LAKLADALVSSNANHRPLAKQGEELLVRNKGKLIAELPSDEGALTRMFPVLNVHLGL
jgi:hypothetical protein